MSQPNYESEWWGYIYDQMMATGRADVLEANRRFYHHALSGVSGPVLECACGTGLIFLPLLASGHDMHGFDISTSMLDTLRAKATSQGVSDIECRLRVQDMETFSYDERFAAILVPTNSFAILTTQEAQIRALTRMADHLAPGGRLLLDLQLAGVRDLAEGAQAVRGRWHTWAHPATGRPIRQRVDGRLDFDRQLVLDRCYIEYDDLSVEFPMTGRWIFRDEFALLLRAAGFTHWTYSGTPEGGSLDIGLHDRQSYWIAGRD